MKMNRTVPIAFVAGSLCQVLGIFMNGVLYKHSASAFESLFADWFIDRGYTESIYYFGSFCIGLPSSGFAFFLGLAIGFLLPGRTFSIALGGSLGWGMSYFLVQLLDGIWWLNSPPYRVVFTMSLALAMGLLSSGTIIGSKMKRRTPAYFRLAPEKEEPHVSELNMTKRLTFLLLAISILLNLYFLVRQMDLSTGGGRHKLSPDGRFLAVAQSKRQTNPLAKDHRPYGELTIRKESIANPPLVSVIIQPEAVSDEMEYRQLENLIQWSSNASAVVFQTPSGQFELRVPNPEGASLTNDSRGIGASRAKP